MPRKHPSLSDEERRILVRAYKVYTAREHFRASGELPGQADATYNTSYEEYTGPTEDAVYKRQKRKKSKKSKPTVVKTQDSKAIKEIAYFRNGDHSVLYIQFNSNPSIFYRYDNVLEVYIQGLLDAKSKGRYFHQNIRNRYKSTKKITVGAMGTLIAGGNATVILDTSNEEQYLQDHLEGLN